MTAQLPAPISNGQSEEDPQQVARAHKTKVEPLEPVSVLVEEHTILLQASNNDQLGFQESPSRNRSQGDGPIAGTRSLNIHVLQALVRKQPYLKWNMMRRQNHY